MDSIARTAKPAIAALISWCLMTPQVPASSVKHDEEIIFFPTSAYLDQDGKTWIIPVHGWIFEPEEDSVWRKEVVEELLVTLELGSRVVDDKLFRKRARMFLVDNERRKKLRLRIGGRVFEMSRSGSNGHFEDVVRIEQKRLEGKVKNTWLRFGAVMREDDKRRFQGAVQLLRPKGVSVISDIDDTIKVTNVMDKRELLANTFSREFRAVAGMAQVYRRWADAGAAFHYVSESPWQLYPFLSDFMDKQGFPRGSFHLKLFRMKDRTFFNLFASPEEAKIRTIESILRLYPKRKFILLGDSTEKDPEVYGAIAKRRPEQVIHAFIRNVSSRDEETQRFRSAFEGSPRERWTVFRDPYDLMKFNFAH